MQADSHSNNISIASTLKRNICEHPEHCEAYLQLADYLIGHHKTKKALRNYMRSYLIDPHKIYACRGVLISKCYLEDFESARVFIAKNANIFKNKSAHFSMVGEDILSSLLFHENYKGFYIDVGACHPVASSNTIKFYINGWSGINIEPMPGSIKAFNAIRSRDVNIECAIASIPGKRHLVLQGVGLNRLAKYGETPDVDSNSLADVDVRRLEDIMDQYGLGARIDFMNLDVEGSEIDAMNSLNLERFRPRVIAIEDIYVNKIPPKTETSQFMISIGYEFVIHTGPTSIYRVKDFGAYPWENPITFREKWVMRSNYAYA